MRAALLVRFFRIQGGVDAAVDDPGAALAGTLPDPVADQGVAGVDADADDVTRPELPSVERLEHLVAQDRVAPFGGCGRGKHVEPARCHGTHTKGELTRVDDVYAHDPPSGLLEAID